MYYFFFTKEIRQSRFITEAWYNVADLRKLEQNKMHRKSVVGISQDEENKSYTEKKTMVRIPTYTHYT